MALISRDTWRAAELQRQALENKKVPSALLLEALKAYTDLKDASDTSQRRADAMQTALADIGGIVLVKSSHTDTELAIVQVLNRISSHFRLFGVWVTPSEADAANCAATWATQSADSITWQRAEFDSIQVAASFAEMAHSVGRPGWRYEVREIHEDIPPTAQGDDDGDDEEPL